MAKTMHSQCRGPGFDSGSGSCKLVCRRSYGLQLDAAKKKKSLQINVGKGVEKKGLLHCWWECKLVQPLWKIVWNFLRKTKNRVAM